MHNSSGLQQGAGNARQAWFSPLHVLHDPSVTRRHEFSVFCCRGAGQRPLPGFCAAAGVRDEAL
jgi:hypothetical protein